MEQIEFANVVVLNTVDGASPEQRDAARKIIRSLNPEADIIEANHSRVPFDRVLDTGRFNFEKAQQHPRWYKELYGFAEHVPETEEYGVRNFVYRARRPFDPAEFDRFIKQSWPGVIRAKGHFWLATRPQWVRRDQPGRLDRTHRSAGVLVGSRPGRTLARRSLLAKEATDALERHLWRPSPGNRVHRHRHG